MSEVLKRLKILAVWLLGAVIASALAVQAWPQAQSRDPLGQDAWPWPNTLQAYPWHPGDPVKLVSVMKDGQNLTPGTYTIPKFAGNEFQNVDVVKQWLRDISFTLCSDTSKTIVSVGIAVVLPARNTDLVCGDPPGQASWCGKDPHWCDRGCPAIMETTLHWGKIPARTASGLEVRYRAKANGRFGDRTALEGSQGLQLPPGREVTLSPVGREDGTDIGMGIHPIDPWNGLLNVVNGIVYREGIDEAEGVTPCIDRIHSKTGCAFGEVSAFNVAVDIVYFSDGTIWGNYGYGYAIPNPDGIFTRADANESTNLARPASGPN